MSVEKIKISEFLIQCAATFCVSFLGCQSGFVMCWPSYNAALFRSNETILSIPMTSTHISLLGSLSNVGGFLVSPFCGYAYNTYGRKYATVMFGLPYVVTWSIISFTTNVYLILFAMAIVGVGVGGQNVSIIYISEIAHDSIRGGLTACSNSGFFLGMLISNAMAAYMTYNQLAYTFLALSVVGTILLLLIKESPVYLVLVGKDKEAAKSISFYKRLKTTSKEVEAEISKIKKQLDCSDDKILYNNENETSKELITAKESSPARRISSWRFLKNSKSSQRALIMVLIVVTLVSVMGSMPLQVYAVPIFTEVVPSLDPNHCAVNMSTMFFVASIVCILAVDRCGRQFLLISSAIICGICALLLGVFIHFNWAPEWCRAMLIYVFSFSYTTGCATTPSVLMAEVFLPEVRSLCNTITLTFYWIISFIVLSLFNPVADTIGLSNMFCIFSCTCFSVAIYSWLYIPETKGMPVDAIQALFVHKPKKIYEK